MTIDADAPATLDVNGITIERVPLSAADDASGALAARYLGEAGRAVYLLRPDQHVAARWTDFDENAVRMALDRAVGHV
jgi:3-(3-hydroxy-phenyl)propionate hydroxylase